jgi:hypothetical protein
MVYGRMLAVEEKTRKGDPGSTPARCTRPAKPCGLPLRFDDGSASPTTPQGQHQQALITETEKELRPGLEGPMRQREPACEATLDVSGRFADEAIRHLSRLPRYIDKGEP